MVHPEQERERAGASPAHFVEAQAKQELWQELRDHGASLNRALNEALWIHSGHALRVFQVSGFTLGFVVSSLAFFRVRAFPDPFSSCLARRRPSTTSTLISEDHVWFEDWWMVASLCDE
jgi:hypothetical protein